MRKPKEKNRASEALRSLLHADITWAEGLLVRNAIAGTEAGCAFMDTMWENPALAPDSSIMLQTRALRPAAKAAWMIREIFPKQKGPSFADRKRIAGEVMSRLFGADVRTPKSLRAEAEEAIKKLEPLTEADMALASAILPYWVEMAEAERFKSIVIAGNLSGDELLEAAKGLADKSSNKDGNVLAGYYNLGHGTDCAPEDDTGERIPISPKVLNRCLNGGLKRGEGTLFIGPSGSGKTVMAIQLAASLTEIGLKGIYITTEQPHFELEPRLWSQGANIPFSKIEAGLKAGWKKLSTHEKQSYEAYRAKLTQNGGTIHWIDWRENRDRSVRHHIEAIVDGVEKKSGPIDYVLLDWLGAALGESAAGDKDQLRLAIQSAADKMADLATDRNLITISFAQASDKAVNVKRVGRSHLAECKTAGNKMTNIIGISALQERDTNADEDAAPLYSIEQWLNVDKSRKGIPMTLRVFREFQFQRFSSERPGRRN